MKHAQHLNSFATHRKAKELRINQTDAEELLWAKLRENSRAQNLKFRRQQPIEPYIADFVCFAARLIVELDGASHDHRIESDFNRDRALEKMGYLVLRFTNDQVFENCDAVALNIIETAKRLLEPNR